MIRPLRVLASTVAAMAALGATAIPASAGVLVASAPDCEAQSLSRPFLPWADPMQYVLAPGGDFEAAGWRTTGDARVVEGNESFNVGGADDSRSLALGDGASASSGVMCVGIEHPTLRLFARNRGSVLGTLCVEVLFEDASGTVRSLPIGTVLGSDWAPTLPMPVIANLLPLLPGERTPVAFRFTAHGGDWVIDDVFVDPRQRA